MMRFEKAVSINSLVMYGCGNGITRDGKQDVQEW